jgi:hypothetical protein
MDAYEDTNTLPSREELLAELRLLRAQKERWQSGEQQLTDEHKHKKRKQASAHHYSLPNNEHIIEEGRNIKGTHD